MKALRQFVQEQSEKTPLGEEILLTESAGPRLCPVHGFNWRGTTTLTVKEIKRFMKIWLQTIVSPLVMTLLFYAVFAVANAGGPAHIGGVPFLRFLVPGLIMLSMAQAAFMNGSASLILSKVQGNIVDLLMAPLSAFELTLGYVLSGLARGLVVGIVSYGAVALLTPMPIYDGWAVAFYAVMGSLMLSLMGTITGIWGRDFDHMGAIQNFIIMPATFLSGTFFSAASLPPAWSWVCTINPFFYMIDGFRYGFTGHADGGLLGGMALLFFINLALFDIAYWMIARGTHLKT